MQTPSHHRQPRRQGTRQSGRSRWHLLLFVPVLSAALVPLLNRLEPRAFGMPFFFWSQAVLVGLSFVVVAVVATATRAR